MPLLPQNKSVAGFDDERRERLFQMQERVGSVKPRKDSFITEAGEGVVSGATQVGRGFASTLDELGYGDPLQAITAWERRNQQYRPSEGYQAFSADPADLARTITTGITQAATGIGLGLGATAITGNPIVGGGVTFASTFGQTYGEEVKDFRRDMSEDDAQLYGFMSAAGQSLLESVLGPERLVGGLAKTLTKESIEETVKKVGRDRFIAIAKSAITEGLSEGSEEVLQDIVSNAFAKAGGREGDVLPSVRDALNNFTAGALPGMLLGGGIRGLETMGGGQAQEVSTPVSQTTDIDDALRQTIQQEGQQLPVIGEGIDPSAPVESIDELPELEPLRAEDIPRVEQEGEALAPIQIIDESGEAQVVDRIAVKTDKDVTKQATEYLQDLIERERIQSPEDIDKVEQQFIQVFEEVEQTVRDEKTADRVINKIQKNLDFEAVTGAPVTEGQIVEAVPEPTQEAPVVAEISEIAGVPEAQAEPDQRIAFIEQSLPFAEVVQSTPETATVNLPNGEAVTVQLVDNIQTPEGQEARGSYLSQDKIIKLANIANQTTADHETFHMAKGIGNITDQDQQILQDRFQGDEEAEAIAYEEFQRAKREPTNAVEAVFKKIQDTFKAIARAFGYSDPNVVFQRVAKGEVFQPAEGVADVREQFQVVTPQNSDSTERRQAVPFVSPEAQAANIGLQEGREVQIQTDAETIREADEFIAARGVENVINDIAEGRLKMDSNVNKQIMNKALDDPSITQMYIDGDQKAMDAMAEWIEQRSEAGRILRLESSLTGDPIKDVQNNIKKMLLAPSKKYKQAKAGRKKEALQKEKELTQKAVDNVKKVTKGKVDPLAITDEQAQDSKLMAKVMREITTTKAPLGDKLYEYWINSILSGFTTHATNVVGNLTLTASDLGPQRLIEATLNTFRNDPKSATFGEISKEWKAMFKAMKPAWDDAKLAWEMEMPTDGVSKLEQPGVAIGGTLGRVIRSFGTRLLLASDEFAKTIINAGESTAFAYRQAQEEGAANVEARMQEILNDPNAEVREIAHNRSLELLHQQETGAFVAMLGQLAKRPGVEGWIGRILFPFRKTPANIIKTSLRKSPLGIFKVFNDVATGQFKGDKSTRQIAEQTMAWTTVGVLFNMIGGSDGDDEIFITGTQDEFGTAKSNWERQNLPSTSIKVGDTWYDYGRVEPFGTILGGIVDGLNAWQMAEDGVESDKIVKKVFNSVQENIVNQTFLQNLNDALKTVESPEGLPRYATNFIASWVPNVYRGTVSKINNTIEDRRNYERGMDWLEYQFGTLVAQKAGFIKGAPRVDTWGREVENRNGLQTGSPLMTAIWRASSPVKTMPDDMEKVDQLVMNYNLKNPNEEWWPNLPQYWYKKSGKTHYMNKEQYHSYAKRAGRLAKGKIDSMIQKGRLNVKNPTKRDITVIRKIITAARKRARIQQGL